MRYRERVGDHQLCAPIRHVAYGAVQQAEGIAEHDFSIFEDATPQAFSSLLHLANQKQEVQSDTSLLHTKNWLFE